MKLYSENNNYKLYHGSMLDMLQVIEPNTIDSIVTDPPYELNFMGKGWDNSGIAFQATTWKNCYEVLKPGGYLLAFGGSRTFHRIACAIEDAGFEIRDTIMWLYGSGFPKSMNIGLALDKKNGIDNRTGNMSQGVGSNNTLSMNSGVGKTSEFKNVYEERKATNEWDGWGTCLKPAFEPIIVARKPFSGSLLENVETYRVGGLNIDECRVELEDGFEVKTTTRKSRTDDNVFDDSNSGMKNELNNIASADPRGRFPANVILTYDETDYDEVCGGMPNVGSGDGEPYSYAGREYNNAETSMFNGDKPQAPSNYNDSGSASRYFYCAKASKKDRDEGCDRLETQYTAMSNQAKAELGRGNTEFHGDVSKATTAMNRVYAPKNIHPTVKPTELMQYLIRLVTPNGGTVLDPFNGSGSTGKATMHENVEHNKDYKYIGIELTEEYLPISKARIEWASVYHHIEEPIKVKEDNSGLQCETLW